MNSVSEKSIHKPSNLIQRSTKSNAFFLIIAIVLIMLIGWGVSESFFNLFNLSRLLRQICISGLISVGMTFVIIGGNGGIDLSVGSTFAISTMLAISLQAEQINNTGGAPYPGLNLPLFLIIIACMLSGVAVGLFNGFGVTKLNVPPFIMTLATLSIGRGLVLVYSNGFQLVGIREDFGVLGAKMIAKYIPLTLITFAVIAVLAYFLAHRSMYGRKLFATGANEKAARISGVKTKRIIMSTYIISGVLAALAGMLFTSFSMVGDPWAGDGYELNAISAVLIGGTPLLGGKGTVTGTVLGLLFVGLMQNLLKHLGINSYVQQLIMAGIILLVVLVQSAQSNKMQRGLSK